MASTAEYFKARCCVLQEMTLSAVFDPEPKGAEIIKLSVWFSIVFCFVFNIKMG